MAEQDVFDTLEDRTEDASSAGGDYADWWEPEDEGDEVVGIVVEKHSAPQDWTKPGEVPDDISTVLSVGRGDYSAGQAVTPKQHKQLKNALGRADIGDLVRLEFTGYEKANGNMMHTYAAAIIAEEEWTELPGAEDIESTLAEYTGISGDNRRTEPYTTQSGGSAGSSGGSAGNDELTEAASALSDVVGIQGGELEVSKAEEILNEIRDFDVDVESAAAAAGLSVEDGVVTR
jgi:hypothetical protein